MVCARREPLLRTLAEAIEELGGEALAHPVDALDEAEAAAAVRAGVERFGPLDVAVLNIGDGPVFNMAEITAAEVRDNMRINYDTLVNFLIPTLEHMKPLRRGTIVHTNSLAGFLGLPMQGPYCAAKSAARILMDTCRIELREYNLRFVSVHPGYIKTASMLTSEQPMPLAISEEKAALHMIRAIERGKADYLFPRVYKALIRLSQVLPKRLVGRILASDLPDEYGSRSRG